MIKLYSVVKHLKITLSFKYIAVESASSGSLVHSRIFLAQYILQKTIISRRAKYFTKKITAKVSNDLEQILWLQSESGT